MVNGSPSISISRRMVLSSLVAMGCRQSDTLARPDSSVEYRLGPASCLDLFPPGEDVVHEPLSVLLTNDRIADHSGILEHVVRGLEHALEM